MKDDRLGSFAFRRRFSNLLQPDIQQIGFIQGIIRRQGKVLGEKKIAFFGHDEDFLFLGLLVWQENSPTPIEIELPDFSGSMYVTWHPDGNHVIFLTNSFVHKASIDGNEPQRELLCELDISPPFDILPSPDDSRLLVNAWMQKQYSVMDYDCENLITGSIPGAYDLLEWTPDGKHIIANKEFVINPETGEVSNLPDGEFDSD